MTEVGADSVKSGAQKAVTVLLGNGILGILQLVSVIVLSRLLKPEDFGLVAMVAVFVSLASLMRDFGMPLASLQVRDLSAQAASNAFWINSGFAFASGLFLLACTPLMVSFYSEPRLIHIVPAMAVVVAVTGLGAQVQVDLSRRLKYAPIVLGDVIAQTGALAIAIWMATVGYGYWALVAQPVIGATVGLAVKWTWSGWRPMRYRRGHGVGDLVKSGTHYGLAQLLTFAQGNVDTAVIGSHLGAATLGSYNRAFSLMVAPMSQLLDPMIQVVVPLAHRSRQSSHGLMPKLRTLHFAVAFTSAWLYATIFSSAPVFVPFLLGPGWEQSIPLVQILSVAGFFSCLNYPNYWLYVIHAKSRALLTYNLTAKPLAVLMVIVGARFGVEGVALAYTVGVGASWVLSLYWLKRSVPLSAVSFASTSLRVGATASVAALTAIIVISKIEYSPVFELSAGAMVVLGVMSGLLTALPRERRLLGRSLAAAGRLRRQGPAALPSPPQSKGASGP